VGRSESIPVEPRAVRIRSSRSHGKPANAANECGLANEMRNCLIGEWLGVSPGANETGDSCRFGPVRERIGGVQCRCHVRNFGRAWAVRSGRTQLTGVGLLTYPAGMALGRHLVTSTFPPKAADMAPGRMPGSLVTVFCFGEFAFHFFPVPICFSCSFGGAKLNRPGRL
jgi:hypothetical protein